MAINADIEKVLKAEGYRINEAIKDGIEELIDLVGEENDLMEEPDEDDTEIEDD